MKWESGGEKKRRLHCVWNGDEGKMKKKLE